MVYGSPSVAPDYLYGIFRIFAAKKICAGFIFNGYWCPAVQCFCNVSLLVKLTWLWLCLIQSQTLTLFEVRVRSGQFNFAEVRNSDPILYVNSSEKIEIFKIKIKVEKEFFAPSAQYFLSFINTNNIHFLLILNPFLKENSCNFVNPSIKSFNKISTTMQTSYYI